MGGSLLSGMSTRVVTPPAAAAEVAAVIPAHTDVSQSRAGWCQNDIQAQRKFLWQQFCIMVAGLSGSDFMGVSRTSALTPRHLLSQLSRKSAG